MIVNEALELCFMMCPGTEAETIHKALACTPGNMWVLGVNADSWADHYTTRIPNRWKTYRRAILVRNPYTRLLELYKQHNAERRTHDNRGEPYSLAEFVGHRRRLGWRFASNVNQWAAGLNPDEVVKFEDINQELGRIFKYQGEAIQLTPSTNWRDRFRGLSYDQLVELYEEFVLDLAYGYFNDAITPTQATVYGRRNVPRWF